MGWFDDQGDIALGLAANRETYERLDALQRAAYAKLGEPGIKDGRVTGVFKAEGFGPLPFGGSGYTLTSATGKTVIVLKDNDRLPARGGHHGWYKVETEVSGLRVTRRSKRNVIDAARILSSGPAPEWRKLCQKG